MLNSLNIKNYRNLKELKINSLGRVNLITGKNNTGKSTLLEAVAIYATKGDFNLIKQNAYAKCLCKTLMQKAHYALRAFFALLQSPSKASGS